MENYSQDFPTLIKEASDRASSLASSSGELAAQLPNIGEMLRTRANAAYNANQDIVQPLDKATSEYLASPQVAREKYQNIFNPFSREKLVTQSVQNTSLPMLSLSSILGNRMGRITDIIGAGTGAFQAQVGAEQAQAQAAADEAARLLGLYNTESDVNYRNESLALEREKMKAAASAGSGTSAIEALLAKYLGGDQNGGGVPQPTEPKPQISDEQLGLMLNRPEINWKSPEGQWVFDPETVDWVPIVD